MCVARVEKVAAIVLMGTSSVSQGLRFINSRTHYFYDGEEIIRSSLPIVDENSFSSSSLIIVLDGIKK